MTDEPTPSGGIEGELLSLSTSRGFSFFLECVRTIALVLIAIDVFVN
jgi:hypothetical protein